MNIFIPIGLVTAFLIYVIYLLLYKKDRKKLKRVFYPGLFFIAVCMIIYFLMTR